MTLTQSPDGDAAVTEQVRARYADAARAVLDRRPTPSDAAASCCGPSGDAALRRDPVRGRRACVPARRRGAGQPRLRQSRPPSPNCGPGEVVLDLGSGGGIDVLLSAQRVGPTGFAYGIDMTDEMLELARANATAAGATNVEFRKGHIESIPLDDASVDVVISNCVINLSTDKATVLAEIARVLRPGGRIGISDVVADDALSPDERAERGSFTGCIAGALSFAEYRAGLEAVGLTDDRRRCHPCGRRRPARGDRGRDQAGRLVPGRHPTGRAAEAVCRVGAGRTSHQLLRGRRLLLIGHIPRPTLDRAQSSVVTGNGSAIGSVASRLRPSASNRSRPRSRTSTSSVEPVSARSAATRATPGPHIIP